MNKCLIKKSEDRNHFWFYACIMALLLFVQDLNAQNDFRVYGSVKDENGEPLIGVNILLEGTQQGVISDIDGNYEINISGKKNILRFSLIGFKTQEYSVTKSKRLDVVLKEDTKLLSEVVVVGYGTQKKINVTGAVGSIDRDEIQAVTTSNLTNSLQGKLPGLNIKQNSGDPGSYDNSIDIRGFGSPLVIIDGVARDGFDRLDPSEIESISILKDASAAIYGVRAANGVLLVTTRKGAKDKTEISLNASYGFQSVTNYPKACDAYQYIELYNESMANNGATTPTYDPELIRSGSPYANVNWYDKMVKPTVPQYQANLSASGGNDKINYYVSLGYMSEDGIWTTNSLNYERYNFRSNISANIAHGLSVDFQVGGYYDNKNAPAYDNWEIFKGIGATIPIYEVYANGNEDFIGAQYNDGWNPLIMASTDISGYNKTQNTQVQMNASVKWDIPFLEGLSAKALIAYDPKFYKRKLFKKQYKTYRYDPLEETYNLVTTSAKSNINEWRENSSTVTSQVSLNYDNTFKEKHHIGALFLFETRKWQTSSLSGGRSTVMDEIDQIYAGLVDDSRSINGSEDRNANVGFIGRVNYDYESKYLAEASFRYDGSSKFRNKRWGFFPSLSLGWRISEESFIKDNVDFIDNLKLRASIGKLGDDNSSAFLWLMAFDYPSSDNYVLGDGGLMPGLGMPQIPNENATWYTSTTKNIGIDLSLWNSALTIEYDWFRRDRDGLLANRVSTVPGTFGATFAQENLNSDMTTGFELAIGHNWHVGDFSYQVKGNLSWTLSRNKYVEQRPAGNSYDNWKNNQNNRNKDIIWGYNSIGQYASVNDYYNNPVLNGKYYNYTFLPGDIMYEDFNGDGMIDEWDVQPILRGNQPDITYGLSLSAQWKGLDLSMFFQGGALFNAKIGNTPMQWGGNSWDIFLDRWHKVDENGNYAPFDPDATWVAGTFPSTRLISPLNSPNSTFWYRTCNYLRLKNIELGYTLPKKVVNYIGAQSMRVYINGFNLLTFASKKLGYIDPENPGGEINQYPIMRNFNFGFNLTF